MLKDSEVAKANGTASRNNIYFIFWYPLKDKNLK